MSVETTLDVRLKIKGMNCEESAAQLQQALLKLPGVHQVRIDASLGITDIHYDANTTTFGEIVRAANECGLQAEWSKL